jgi:N-methylhydantoinase B
LRAQIACCETGEKRLLALINKYGKETLNEAIEAIIAHDETIMREAIAEIPDGEYYAEGGLDSNGLDDNPFKICVTVRVKGDEIVFDTTGSAPQQPGPTNCPYQTAVAICRLITKMIFEPHTRSSEGHWRPLTVITPEGSVFNPQPPAPTWLYGWVGGPLGECILKALAEVLPEKVVARSGGDICAGAYSYGINPRDGRWFAAGAGQGPVGQGASFDRDGGDALIHYNMSGSEAIPIEVFEERSPLRTECWSLRQNSGGPGKFRGGLGIERRVRALSDGWVDGVMEQTKYPAWGLFGGKSALPNIGILWPGTPKEKRFGKICHIPFLEGEVNCVLTGGGGGWGNPYERDVQAVLTDVIRGYVSLDSARKDYGVVIREEDGRYVLDEEGTDQLRKQKTEGA